MRLLDMNHVGANFDMESLIGKLLYSSNRKIGIVLSQKDVKSDILDGSFVDILWEDNKLERSKYIDHDMYQRGRSVINDLQRFDALRPTL